jgi:hypothetical protein
VVVLLAAYRLGHRTGVHAFGVFGFGGGGPWGREWEERKIREMVDEESRR